MRIVGKNTCINHFFGRLYNKEKYNCLHFTCEVWEYLTGESNLLQMIIIDGHLNMDRINKFEILEKPVDPCLVYFKRDGSSHTGVYYRGRILHITESGVRHELVETLGVNFRKVRYFICK